MGRGQDLTPTDRRIIVGTRKMVLSVFEAVTALGFSQVTVVRVRGGEYVNLEQRLTAREHYGRC